MLLQTTMTNDPTKKLLQILREDMQHLRQQEMKQSNMLCDSLRSNKGAFTGNSYYNARCMYSPQQPHIPSSQPIALSLYSPHQSHL